jgi:LPXTG-motif cell wall-anchored protein
MEFELVEYLDFIMGMLLGIAFMLFLYLLATRKKRK